MHLMKMIQLKSFVVTACLAAADFWATAQIAISNPGFETYTSCPNNVSQISRAAPWINSLGALAGTPDFFNCAYTITGVDYGGITAQSGTGFAGCFCEIYNSTAGYRNYKEYFTTQFPTPLVGGTTYTFSFYVAHLYGSSTPATNFVSGTVYTDLPEAERGFLGAAFSTAAPVAANTEGVTSPRWTSIRNDFGLGRVLIPATNTAVYGAASRNNWVPVTLQYTASGGETFMTIGQFRPGNTSLPADNAVYFLFDGFSSQLTALPVSFGNIEATIKNGQVSVNWQTTKETNNSHFIVEASADGRTFATIGKVASKATNGISESALNYTFERSLSHIALGAGLLSVLLGGAIALKRKVIAWMLMGLGAANTLYSCAKDVGTHVYDADGTYFIRIAQIDKDGTKAYSKTVSVIRK